MIQHRNTRQIMLIAFSKVGFLWPFSLSSTPLKAAFFHFKLRCYYILSNVRTWAYASFLTIIAGFILAIIKQKSLPFGWGTLDSWINEVEVNYNCKFEERKSQSAHSKVVKPSLGRCASQHANVLIHSQPKKCNLPASTGDVCLCHRLIML